MNKLKSRMASTFLLYDKRNEAMNTLCLKFFVSLVLFVKSIVVAMLMAPSCTDGHSFSILRRWFLRGRIVDTQSVSLS